MRIATWNVNSLPARLEKVWWWLDRARPDVLLLQETKLADAAAPHDAFRARGYEIAHHGEGRWNGVAIASRLGLADVVTNFGEPRTAPAEARMIAATAGGVRVVSVYAPNGRTLGSATYDAKLAWFDRLGRWTREDCDPSAPLVIGGDFNVAPTDLDVWDATACHGGTHVSAPERERIADLCAWGLSDAYRLHHPEGDRYSWWDYRAGMFYKNYGMRIDLVLVTRPVAERVVWADIDREARKGKPTPSDHAPVVIDVEAAGAPIDAGWEAADKRIAARRRKAR
jgi:exodeoxyribonuclease III